MSIIWSDFLGRLQDANKNVVKMTAVAQWIKCGTDGFGGCYAEIGWGMGIASFTQDHMVGIA